MMGRSSIISVSGYQGIPYKYRPESPGLLHGPLRVVCFCIFAVITPALFIAVPLVMRFVLYGSAMYHISPSDMRIVDERISTTWCSKQTISSNTTFSAYNSDGIPHLSKASDLLNFKKTLIIPDDYKEYWGFYLLQGSQYKISACARFKGGTLLIVKGRQHLEYCAYIGNLNSDQVSDEFSDSGSVERNPSDPDFNSISKSQKKKTRVKVPPHVISSQEEMSILLSKMRAFVKKKPYRYQKLKNKLLDWNIFMASYEHLSSQNETLLGQEETSQTETSNDISSHTATEEGSNIIDDTTTQEHHHHYRHKRSTKDVEPLRDSKKPAEHGKIIRKRREIDIQKISESGENGAFEEGVFDKPLSTWKAAKSNEAGHVQSKETPDSIWKTQHNLHSGGFNTSDPADKSNSESESSYSSSEEALAKCEGIVASFFLSPMPECGSENETQFEIIPSLFNSTVDASGYYYFILGSENEKTDNFMQIKFELEKYEYELPEPIPECVNVQHCELPLNFGSNQKLVVSVPQPSPDSEDSWDKNYILESECEPRTGLYLIFVICLPVMILMCAFQ